MGSILTYGGLTAKIRAMQSKLVNDEELREITTYKSVSQVASFLKNHPGYKEEWSAMDESAIHRGELEKHLRNTLYRDYQKLYRFSNQEQRKFLILYSQRYEIHALKDVLINILDYHETLVLDYESYEHFIGYNTPLDLPDIAKSTTLEEFLHKMEKTEYGPMLKALYQSGRATYFEYSMGLDLYYYTKLWKVLKKMFRGEDLEELTKTFGQNLDILNLQFFERATNGKGLLPAFVYAYMIPVHYKLSNDEVRELVDAITKDEYNEAFRKTFYARKSDQLNLTEPEELLDIYFRRLLKKEARKHPYSAITIFQYLVEKEREIDRLTMAIECVRYEVSQAEAEYYLRY